TSPGSRNTPLLYAAEASGLEVWSILDERSAGFFALGTAQATGLPAIVACTSGSAAANVHPAVVEADEAGVPLVVLTSDRPPELRGIGAGQTIDQMKLYGAAVRWFSEVGTHDADDAGLLHYRATACRAYAVARGEPRPGPVHLNLAWRDPLGGEDRPGDVSATSTLALEGRGERPLTAVSGTAPLADPALLDELAELLSEAPRGLVLAGRQTDPALAPAVVRLAEASGYPILAEPTSQLRFGGHDRSLVIWPYDAIARVAPDELAPDLVVRFGDMPTSKALRTWLGGLDELRTVTIDPAFGWNEPTRKAARIVRASASETADGLTERLKAKGDGAGAAAANAGWTEGWIRAAEGAAEVIATGLSSLDEPSEPGVHSELPHLYEDGDLVYTASSMPIRDQEAFAAGGPAAVRFLCNRGANGIDGLISSGIGAAVATGEPAWIVTGDLGLLYDAAGLGALKRAAAPVRIVVLNNDGGGIFEFLPQAGEVDRDEFEALFATPAGLDLATLAELYGIAHQRISSLEELGAAANRTGIIEIPIERSKNTAIHRDLSDAVAGSLRARHT
ncbi:MAG: 2-succinyl-5-enolpyruvyl-6-hydroxy-3-cyclohexene-1-carboxylic-acid synthase, partial [Solirubrobacterales bacterium]